jgi:RNA polymerase sigma-70 factor (ECF subfamily)
MDDGTIITKIREGDREAYRLLVDNHRDRVFGILVRMTADRDLAAELTQEAFVKAYLKLESFRGDSSFGTWVVQIAIHAARDVFRRHRRDKLHGVVSLEEFLEQSAVRQIPADRNQRDALSQLQLNETGDRLEKEIDALPAPYREVFVLKHVEGWSFERISETTGDSVGSLKVRAHRARRMLRDALTRPARRERPRAERTTTINGEEADHGRTDGTLP